MFTRAINGKHNTYIETHSVLEMAGSLTIDKNSIKMAEITLDAGKLIMG